MRAATTLDWKRDGQHWPHRETSQFVEAAGLRWHVQVTGSGPVILLVHGTGASTHSWRRLVPLLATRCTVVAMDLPGHAFTERPPTAGMTLPAMAAGIGALVSALGAPPELVVGHSAGAAILCRMCIDGHIAPMELISLNGALLPFSGMAGVLFPKVARLLFDNAIAAQFMAWRAADRRVVEQLLEGVGSRLDCEGVNLYQRLFRSPAHVESTLRMMASWDLNALKRTLNTLETPVHLVVASEDRAVPPDRELLVRRLLPKVRTTYLRGVGHLAHEERPEDVARLVLASAALAGRSPQVAGVSTRLPFDAASRGIL